ncbi:MAG TPA: hypothetical protein VNG33_14115, partial [Polyangiaceae bacterium]|nr:hypothetical protein [Polyangiaceae bacterium]
LLEAGTSDWFSPARLKSSSWTDLPTQANWEGSGAGRFFSIAGSGSRDFYLSNNFGGCTVDQGWLMFTNATGCSYEAASGRILYASGSTKQLASSMAQADTLMIFGR